MFVEPAIQFEVNTGDLKVPLSSRVAFLDDKGLLRETNTRNTESLDSSMGAVLHRHSKKYKMKSGQPLVRPNAAMLEYILTDLEPFLTTELLTPYQVLQHQRNHFKWAKMRLARSTAQQNSFYAVVCQLARRLKRKQPTMESARVAQRLIFGKYFDLRYSEFLVQKKLKSTDRATALHLRGMLKS